LLVGIEDELVRVDVGVIRVETSTRQSLALRLVDEDGGLVSWLVAVSMALNRLPTGLVIPVAKRGFCRGSAARSVDPARGSPEMKWMPFLTLCLFGGWCRRVQPTQVTPGR
jgi:hypothetical protein